MQRSVTYTLIFATTVCVICSLFVSSAAVMLKERQKTNFVLDRQAKILSVAGLIQEGEKLSPQEIRDRYQKYIVPRFVDLSTGEYVEEPTLNPETYDPKQILRDPKLSREAPENPSRVARIPNHALIYQVVENGDIKELILPIEGKGLWSTLRGYLALEKDAQTVRGLIFYEQAETPGLGGEVENPKWRALWKGRKVFDEQGTPKLAVIKGQAGTPEQDPYRVDGLSGATITSRSVTYMIQFWLSENGFGPFLKRFREGAA
ncbi:MAG TPA: Na(+)-translocating NADH-quinone reductase subunit C [Candidatus Hydrogenedentes bacterium]|nr:Na(+)-translocating NADH-quinone reductase subunit C [Candidatus Hydrogenedentota bacterium]HOL77187.1 Na(+)-translocating NADH-quinone reductase subunit C [Candidatus Hydrogenedentota bacterium]HPO85874.1 Na(+)-translocating NADH-quinone reductase subunit C [Candidatus Hydrogenedentota bacterium]